MRRFTRMEMPEQIQIAAPIEDDGRIDARTLLVMRNNAWFLFHEWLMVGTPKRLKMQN
jgi:hypothetical protein